MKTYLCGPITGLPQNNAPVFYHYQELLEEAGYTIVNPHEIVPELTEEELAVMAPLTESEKQGLIWKRAMSFCIREMLDCNEVITLPGWEFSKGATIEVRLARDFNIEVKPLAKVLHDRSISDKPLSQTL